MTRLLLATVTTLTLGTHAVTSHDTGAHTAPLPAPAATHCFTVPYYTVPVALCIDARFPWRSGT